MADGSNSSSTRTRTRTRTRRASGNKKITAQDDLKNFTVKLYTVHELKIMCNSVHVCIGSIYL